VLVLSASKGRLLKASREVKMLGLLEELICGRNSLTGSGRKHYIRIAVLGS
jgi:hypothetical protein